MKKAHAEAPHILLATLDGQPARQTNEDDLHLKVRSQMVIVSVFVCKLKDLANSRGSYPLADMVTSDNTFLQVHSIFVR